MKTTEVADHLRELTYLPDWEFEVEEVGDDAPMAYLYAIVYSLRVTKGDVILLAHFPAPESSDAPGEEATVNLARPLVLHPPDIEDAETLEDLVFLHLARVQLHELSELVKFGGRAPFHNHRRDGKDRLAELSRVLSARLLLPL